jgi:MFS family permease
VITETPTSRVHSSSTGLLSSSWYRHYVLGILFLTYIFNVMDRSQVLGVNLQSIKLELGVSDAQLGLLGGIPFAIFYSILGIPIAALADRWSRRNVLALAVAIWSGMTALCGMAVNFATLFAARVGVAIGEAGGSPPSHSLISDYFPKSARGTAFSIFALAVPVGTMIGAAFAGWSNVNYGWRATFMIVGLPGVALALLAWLTIKEPPRGLSDNLDPSVARAQAPPMFDVIKYLWHRRSFVHLSLAAALHSVVWYGAGQWNPTFFIRSHGWTAQEAGGWIAVFAGIGGLGTFFGGYAADKLSVVMKDRRWYVWVPGLATLAMVPFQFFAYMASSLPVIVTSFSIMTFLAAVFFGPSFTMTQALATLRMRSVATSLLLFVQTLIGFGLGPFGVGRISDALNADYGRHSLRYALVIIGLTNIWAAAHYMWSGRTLRQDLEATEKLAAG